MGQYIALIAVVTVAYLLGRHRGVAEGKSWGADQVEKITQETRETLARYRKAYNIAEDEFAKENAE